eukprot:11015710-Prorocentrum_lima.AAC.1
MTSSLVGSEMCIRDRFVTSASPQTKLVAASTTRRGRYCTPPAPGCKAVSYTHLTLPTICSV